MLNDIIIFPFHFPVLSDLMDAIRFVLGEPLKSINVGYMGDELFGSARESYVTAKFEVTRNNSGSPYDLILTRSIREYGYQYQVNYEPVSEGQYTEKLKQIDIDELGYFLFPYGTLREMVEQTPLQRTLLFEKVSKSLKFKDRFDRIACELRLAEAHTNFILKKKKYLLAEKSSMVADKKNYANFANFKKERDQKLKQFYVFQLYHIERNIIEVKNEIKCEKNKLPALKDRKNNADLILKEKEKVHEQLCNDMTLNMKKVKDIDAKINTKKMEFKRANDKVKACNATLEEKRKISVKMCSNTQYQSELVIKLNEKYSETNKELVELDEKISTLDYTRHMALEMLDEGTFQEYKQLLKIDNESLDDKVLSALFQDTFENAETQLTCSKSQYSEVRNAIENIEMEKKETEGNLSKLKSSIQAAISNLSNSKRTKKNLEKEILHITSTIDEFKKQLTTVKKGVPDQKFELFERNHRQEHQQTIVYLKKKFSGVYGRVIDFVRPKDSRHSVVITKLFNDSMNRIIVDTKETSQKCLKALRERNIKMETIIAIDCIPPGSLNNELRNIKGPGNRTVNLAYDLVAISHPKVIPAILSIVGNALVCETGDDAQKISEVYEGQMDVFALDGTHYRKSGFVVYGVANSQIWDEKLMEDLKKKVTTEMIKQTRLKCELRDLDKQIEVFEKSSVVMKQRIATETKTILKFDNALKVQYALLHDIEKVIEKETRSKQQMTNELSDIENKMRNSKETIYEG